MTLIVSEPQVSRGDRAAFERVYLDAFPATEREPIDELLAAIGTGRYQLLVARVDGELAGFAVSAALGRDVYYLQYLAVDRRLRGAGIGTQLMSELRSSWVRFGARGAVWEVDSHESGLVSERDLRVRRIRFYTACGAEIVTCAPHYRAPSFSGGSPLDMKLMWLPLGSGPEPLTGELLQWCLLTLLTRIYGLRSDDPIVVANLRATEC
jgi:ribosomal protein S18 acetylase RimI-like enzyme